MRFSMLIIAFLSFTSLIFGQGFSYPKLVSQANKVEELTLKNWKIIDTAIGDLNNDKSADIALIYEYDRPINERRAYGDNESEFISEYQKPRILAIYFKQAKTNKYVLSTQNNNFILRAQEGGILGEPLKEIAIENNALKIFFEGGNDWRWKLNYQFKHQQNDWILVSAGNTYYNNTSGEMTDKSYDFLNRRLSMTTGNIFKRSSANHTTEEILYFTNLRTFKSFKKPWTWEIEKDSFL